MIVVAIGVSLSHITDKDKHGMSESVASGTMFWSSNIEVDTAIQTNFDLNQKQAFFDFDSESIINDNSADVYFSVSCGSDCFYDIRPINGATMSEVIEQKAPGYDGCKSIPDKVIDYFFVPVKLNTFICLRTNQGNIVQIFISSTPGSKDGIQLLFDYIIWRNS